MSTTRSMSRRSARADPAATQDMTPTGIESTETHSTSGFSSNSTARVLSEQSTPQNAAIIERLESAMTVHSQQIDSLRQMMETFVLNFKPGDSLRRNEDNAAEAPCGGPVNDEARSVHGSNVADQLIYSRPPSEAPAQFVTCNNTQAENDSDEGSLNTDHRIRNDRMSGRISPMHCDLSPPGDPDNSLNTDHRTRNDRMSGRISPMHCDLSPPGDPYNLEYFPPHSFATIPINQINPPTFDGDRSQAHSWLRNYEDTMNINGYGDDQKLRRARAYLTGEAKQWFSARMRLDKHATWQSLKSSFLRHFCGINSMDFLRKKLSETRQKPDEHPSSFLVRVIDLCMEYNPRMSDENLVHRVATGLNDATYNALAAVKKKDLWTIDWITETFEQFRVSGGKRSNRETHEEPKNKPTSAVTRKLPRDLSTWICLNCGQTGHVITDCKSPLDEARIKAKKAELKAAKMARQSEKQHGDQPTEERGVSSLGADSRAQLTKTLPGDEIVKPTLTFSLNGRDVTGRIDTGADLTVIPSHVADELHLELLPWDQPALRAVGNANLKVTGMASVLVSYGKLIRPIIVVVMPDTSLKQPLWGMDILQAFQLKLDLTKTNFTAEQCVSTNVNGTIQTQSQIASLNADDQHPLDKITFGPIDPETKALFEKELLARANTFSRDDSDIGRTSTIKHRIHLTDDKPVHSAPFRTPLRNQTAMSEAIDRLRSTGAIRESKSPYASPVFFVDKDHGKGQRLVADYRALNAKTIPDRQPMPHPEEVFSLLAGTKVYAKLDITSMFNQIEVDELDVEKTAIITQFGLFECPLMPFGLKNAPATAVRLMREVLREINGKTCFVYFDDIIVYAPNVGELLQRCIVVLDKISQHGLKLKPIKCVFAAESVKFLGHLVSARGIEVDPSRIEHVMKFPIPRNPSDVRSFHGLCSYNRKFIRNFAEIAKPLTLLTGKPADFNWNLVAQESFETLRKALISAPILVHFNPDADHELRTDASSIAIGAVLYQKHQDAEQTGVVLYYSKSLNSAQRNYSATERELLAVFLSITELQHYLFGKKFTLVTDHAALSLLKNGKDPHKRLSRWVAQLQSFEFDVVYKKGSIHVDADCMSRFVPETEPTDETLSSQGEDIIRALCHVTAQDDPSQDPQVIDDPVFDIRTEQREDPYCKKYIDILESDNLTDNEKLRLAKNFTIQDDILYRVRLGDIYLLVVPERRRAAILLSCHDVPLAGHLGFSRTYGIIKCRYFWPKMRRDIKKYVLSCLACQRRKAPNTRKQGLTRPLPIAEEVFDTIGIDLLTKLPLSHSKFNTILVCTDNLSKFVIAVPLKNELAETILHAFFNNVIAKHGCPRQVLSDNGSNLIGERSRDFFRLFGIKRLTTSAYHPQTNGQTERYNRTLATSLTMYVERNQKDWPDFIQALTFAYNISEHSVTRVTPFEMVYGRKPRIPIDNLMNRNEFIDPTRPAPGILSSTAINMMKQLVLENQQKNKRRLDSRLAPSSFKEGDYVLVERPTHVPGAANKLTYTYLGPYKIVKKISDLSYEIRFPRQRQGGSVVHPCHLKRYVPREGNVADESVDPNFIPRSEIPLSEPAQEASEIEETMLIDEPAQNGGLDEEINYPCDIYDDVGAEIVI